MARRCVIVLLCLLGTLCLVTSCFADISLPMVDGNENRVPAGTLKSGVLILHLEIREGLWRPGSKSGPQISPEIPNTIDGYFFAEEGHTPQNPGPLIRVPQDTEIQVSIHNLLLVPADVHGLNTHPSDDDNGMRLEPGESKEARFLAGAPGTYFYWAATTGGAGDAARARGQSPIEKRRNQDGTMSGAFVVDPSGTGISDRIFVIQIWAKNVLTPRFQGVLTINGKSWPYTERLEARLGEPQHWRVVNATPIPHPMHLHGFYFDVDGVSDGNNEHYYSATERRLVVTESVPAGHSFDMTWVPERAGNWIFHCHILDHMTAYISPVVYGPQGPPPSKAMDLLHHSYSDEHKMMGMAKLVLGITVTGNRAKLVPAKAVINEPGATRHLIVREREGTMYASVGPGFYLEGVSRKVEPLGPPLVITQGVRTAITVTNELKQPTAIHWHGIEIESKYDGVPGWDGTPQHTTPAIAPGASFVAYMTPPRAGTFIYHTHWHDIQQLTGGMYGALLVLPPGQKYDPVMDKVFVLGRCGPNEFHDPLMLNGSPQPGVMFLLSGQSYRLRFVNITPNDSPVALSMELGGKPVKWRAMAKDGADLPEQQAVVEDATGPLSVGETRDFEFSPKLPGRYVLRFESPFGSELTQVINVVPPGLPISAYATGP
jgi:FtsP/CotA-like multicopper oxidase with cupredoxin domain